MHQFHVPVDHLQCEVFLVLEVMIERTLRHLRSIQQRLHTQIVIAMLEQHRHPRIEQTLLG
jgi:hypothetical protein